MEKIWHLLVAIFLVCVSIALGLAIWLFEGTVIAGVSVYAFLILLPVGIIKGFYNIFTRKSGKADKEV